ACWGHAAAEAPARRGQPRAERGRAHARRPAKSGEHQSRFR
ncbi:MAG: hypothetical protein AVDCRST_MAG34-2862, partial [uncultured Nocardioidaceae bacterium]